MVEMMVTVRAAHRPVLSHESRNTASFGYVTKLHNFIVLNIHSVDSLNKAFVAELRWGAMAEW